MVGLPDCRTAGLSRSWRGVAWWSMACLVRSDRRIVGSWDRGVVVKTDDNRDVANENYDDDDDDDDSRIA